MLRAIPLSMARISGEKTLALRKSRKKRKPCNRFVVCLSKRDHWMRNATPRLKERLVVMVEAGACRYQRRVPTQAILKAAGAMPVRRNFPWHCKKPLCKAKKQMKKRP